MKKALLFASAVALCASSVWGQKLEDSGYITWPESQKLYEYVTQWNGGNGTIKVGGKDWEDMNFFIPRVKTKQRFRNQASQIYPFTPYNMTTKAGNDRRLVFWVPNGDEGTSTQHLNALADGIFDGEVFNMWSYLDMWGNWNSPHGFTPGNFADACHKNGVATHGVASVPWGSINANWKTSLQSLSALNHDAVGKFLRFFGQDGMGYNSEWSGYTPTDLMSLHNDLKTYFADKNHSNPLWENMWYAGTNDNGSIYFDQGISTFQNLFNGTSLFMNYGWAGNMQSSIQLAKNWGKNPFYIYAGCNMQGGEPSYNWARLKDYQYSIGLWGAHSNNMLWKARYGKGSSDKAKTSCYLETIEQWFGNGPRNPAIKIAPYDKASYSPEDGFCGMSSLMSARSSLSWDLNTEPFVTYFNIGNGAYLNWKGERQNSKAWHNIGMQDYMPTWHYWFAPSWMDKNVSASSVHLKANVNWDEAYVGGSCLEISGTTDTEYLHLFKTNFSLDWYYQITVRYKLLEGEADVNLVFGTADDPETECITDETQLLTVAESDAVNDECYTGKWIEKTFIIDGDQITDPDTLFDPDGDGCYNVGVIGLKFENAKNLKFLLGELRIENSESNFAAPAAPQITLAKVLKNSYSGVDAKVIWNMANSKAVGEPVYNEDVKAKYFRVWYQQEGKEAVNTSLTTSWAAIVFAAPFDPAASSRVRVGVSAVGLDQNKESAIAWSDYMSAGTYQTSEKIECSKPIIKPNEKFDLYFVDENHAAGSWQILNDQGVVKFTGTGNRVTCPGLDAVGGYDVKLTYNGNTTTYASMVSISGEEVGALPEIYSIALNDDDVTGSSSKVSIDIADTHKVSYTGRKADGSASRGIDLSENFFGVRLGDLGLAQYTTFSIAFWVKLNDAPNGPTNFIAIEDRIGGGWPYNNWGYFWARLNEDGKFIMSRIDTAWGMRAGTGTEGMRIYHKYNDARIPVGVWTHIAIVFEYQGNQRRNLFYINGQLQTVNQYSHILKSTAENNVGDWSDLAKLKNVSSTYQENVQYPPFVSTSYPVTEGMWFSVGGHAPDLSPLNASIDDYQVWTSAMTPADVQASINGLDRNNLPSNVLGFWDFETDANADLSFTGFSGAGANPKAYLYEILSSGENANTRHNISTEYKVGCPFISGTAYPVVTTAKWKDTDRKTVITPSKSRAAATEGELGSATVKYNKAGEHTLTLTLENGYGEHTLDFPVVNVIDQTQGIGDITADGETAGLQTYTIDRTIFVQLPDDAKYRVEVYNIGGALEAAKTVSTVAGQNVALTMAAQGVYLVKVANAEGAVLRTFKVVTK